MHLVPKFLREVAKNQAGGEMLRSTDARRGVVVCMA
jgi:hypothetical protein